MSGGKYATESATFTPSITAAVFGALMKQGTEAVAQAGKAVELQKLLARERLESAKKMEALRRETESILQQAAQQQAAQQQATQQRATAPIAPVIVRTEQAQDGSKELLRQICETADTVIAEETSYSARAQAIKQEAQKGGRRTEELRRLYDRLCAFLPEARRCYEKQTAQKEMYHNELARAKALCHITHTLAAFPEFSEENIDQVLLRLKEISASQIRLIEQIKANPAMRMTREEREKARETVANKICAALADKDVRLCRVSAISQSKICYYYYHDALLKVAVTDTGMVTMEVVGDPEKKTGFTSLDKKKVLAAMQRFQTEYPELAKKLSENNVVLNLHGCVEPSEDIVTYQEPEYQSEEERAADEAALLAMLQNVQQARYAGGGA